MSTSQLILIWAVPVLFAITVHEIAHGWVAARFGDTTARDAGRLTLNPIPHIHWLGTVVLPLALGTLAGVVAGWAKPVPVNAGRLQNPRRDMAWVAVAGPAANVLMALAWAGISRMGWQMGVESEFGLLVYLIGQAGIMVNIVLMLFNLLPIPPLDGAVIVSSVLPPRWGTWWNHLFGTKGIVVAMGLVLLAMWSGTLLPVFFLIINAVQSLFGLPTLNAPGS